jgi:hypothetical protein
MHLKNKKLQRILMQKGIGQLICYSRKYKENFLKSICYYLIRMSDYVYGLYKRF